MAFQNKNAINTLLNEGKLIANPIFVSKEDCTAYKYIVRHMKQKGIDFTIDFHLGMAFMQWLQKKLIIVYKCFI